MPTRRITYRLYPSVESSRKLHRARKMHCELYNAAIANRRTQPTPLRPPPRFPSWFPSWEGVGVGG